MKNSKLYSGLAAGSLTLLLAGCAGSGISPEDVEGVPEAWVTDTAEGWPSSDSFGASMPVLSRGTCELIDEKQLPEILGETPKLTDSGWGPLGQDRSDENSYRYECGIWSSGNFAGSIELLHPGDAAVTEALIDEFERQPSTAEQDNTVTSESSHGLTMPVLTRWYPTNPQGRYVALYHDEAQDVLVRVEINSLDEADFEAFSPQEAADTLVEILAAAS